LEASIHRDRHCIVSTAITLLLYFVPQIVGALKLAYVLFILSPSYRAMCAGKPKRNRLDIAVRCPTAPSSSPLPHAWCYSRNLHCKQDEQLHCRSVFDAFASHHLSWADSQLRSRRMPSIIMSCIPAGCKIMRRGCTLDACPSMHVHVQSDCQQSVLQ
jgi:hypothetical protein